MTAAEVHVCQAGSCRRAGSEAVLLEIEELAKDLPCAVHPSGCVGACSQAPNAIVVKRGSDETLHTHIDDVEKSAAVVLQATGQAPSLDDPGLRQRLTAARRMRVRKRAREENKWNLALAGMAEQVASTADPEDKVDLQYEYAQVCRSAGQWEQALRSIEEVEKVVGVHPEVLMEKAKLLAKLGKHQELVALGQSARGACGPNAIGVLKSCEKEAAQHPEEPQARRQYYRPHPRDESSSSPRVGSSRGCPPPPLLPPPVPCRRSRC